MKRKLCRKIILSVISLLNIVPLSAHDFEVDGIYYNILDDVAKTAEVTFKGETYVSEVEYYDEIEIPSIVTFNGIDYSIVKIGDYAFFDCPELSAIHIPNTIDSIGYRSFENNTTLNSVYITDLGAWCNIIFESYPLEYATGLYLNNNILTDIEIPTTITYIKDYSFRGYKSLKSVRILETVNKICTEAFSQCENLVEVSLPNSLDTLGSRVFSGCKSLTTINLPDSIKELGGGVFQSTGLMSIKIPSGIKIIKDRTFALCKDLAIVELPESLTEIGAGAFISCENISEINIPKGVTTINNYAFNGCIKLETFNIPETVTNLGRSIFTGTAWCEKQSEGILYKDNCVLGYKGAKLDGDVKLNEGVRVIASYAFSGFTAMDFILLPESVDVICSYAFYNCKNIGGIKSLNPIPPYCDSLAFENAIFPICVLYVPSESIEAYKNADVWCNFARFVENELTEPNELPSGVYYAKKGSNLCYYKDGQEFDTGVNVGVHPFNLQSYNNTIYVSDAGEQYYYMSGGDTQGGDGAIYRVANVGDIFRSLAIKNTGAAFSDPFTCWIDTVSGELYSCTRSQGVYKFGVDDVNWNSSELSQLDFFVSSWSQLPLYTKGIGYGAITHGIQKDKDNVYWQLFCYNGNLICRYDASLTSFGDAAASGTKLTAFYLDETNGYLYAFSREPSNYGLYRIAVTDLAKSNSLSNWELIDNSPASPENATTDEGVHVRQITGDGENIYWSYIADTENAEAANPLHRSGIKMISAKGTPTVSYIVPDVEAYGFVIITESDDSGVESVLLDTTSHKLITIVGQTVKANVDIALSVYTVGGQLVYQQTLEAGQQVDINNQSSGIYLISALSDDRQSQVEKIVVR